MSERLPPIGEKPRHRKNPPRPYVIIKRKREHRPRKGNYVAFMRDEVMHTFTAPEEMTDEQERKEAYALEWGCRVEDVTICTVARSYKLMGELKQRYKPKPPGPPKYAYVVRTNARHLASPVFNQPLTPAQIEVLKASYNPNTKMVDVYFLGEE